MLTEKTKTDFGFVLWAIIPVTVWLTSLSVMVRTSQASIEDITAKLQRRGEFERGTISRLARIETLLEQVNQHNKR